MDKSKMFKYRLFIPMLALLVIVWALVLTGIMSFAVAMVVQSVGVSLILVVNAIWIAVVDIPAAHPDSNYTRQLNRLTFVKETD